MALEIKKTGLKNWNGGQELPEEGVIVRFKPIGDFQTLNHTFELRYYLNQSFSNFLLIYEKEVMTYNEEGEEIGSQLLNLKLIEKFTEILTLEKIGALEQVVNQMADGTFQRVMLAYHLIVKEKLESILGENTVVLRLDLV